MFLCNDFCGLDFLKGLKGIVFDCDGVLFDTMGLNRRFYNLIRERLGMPPMNEDEENYVHAHAVRESIAYITPAEREEEVREVWKSIDYRELIPAMVPSPGLYELLPTLRSAGLRMAVYTNRTNTMEMVLDRFDLAQYFELVVTAGNVTPKPHPEGMYHILGSWNVQPTEIAYVGDTSIDAEVAESAGVPFWAYRNELLKADMFLNDFWSLRRCVMRAAGNGGVLGKNGKRPHFFA
ncbi:HAD superfamily hydrolase (TIGR01549 family) [Desulfobaculum xiamenense]|uniref:phosphoglycolate phosphatase n=1 Tax=Desulfobaculum xiamenense TaxID=995050 RepID=A0A846QN31_9BACT|nr:HAD family hydrolase [Desulfobaculum xiamenense]NJB66644.1 HAD superfamily hydrolase (TIGR01549 family) [Desulfobaculum xiamenense]